MMSSKCLFLSSASGARKRKAIVLEEKLKILAQHEGGKPVMVVACG